MASSASSTNNLELEKSGFKRVRSDIEVGPEGLLTANMPDKGSAGTVALGIPGGRSQVASIQVDGAAFGQSRLEPTFLQALELLEPAERR